ncbi:hypothetical protein FHR99_002466 [Litorivivens lipolytica]|uniref:SnoaL-like domain-containing protein n=1 Tax=Litorivivens lipolytica TaxID=1524264 RepID=A0A7W4W7C5_9GAMM|nr:nuclear transport factor 2 family protein [Litorivivens lipolytica]MBB3048192.1 hypothetical protein [Litorivivens lipolytica]
MTNHADDYHTIMNTLALFPRVVDNKQWDKVGDVFAAEVCFDYGDGGEKQGLDALVKQFKKFHDRCSAMQHLLGSIHVEIDGDTALTRAYVQARHQGIGDKRNAIFDTHGEYTDQWQRLPEGWRIVRRDASWSVFAGDASVLFD